MQFPAPRQPSPWRGGGRGERGWRTGQDAYLSYGALPRNCVCSPAGTGGLSAFPSHTPPGAAGPPGTSGLVFLVLKQVERSHFLSQDRGEFLTGTSLPGLLAFHSLGTTDKSLTEPCLAHCDSAPGGGPPRLLPPHALAPQPGVGGSGPLRLCPPPGPFPSRRLSFLVRERGEVICRRSVHIRDHCSCRDHGRDSRTAMWFASVYRPGAD